MFSPELQKIFDETVRKVLDQFPTVITRFKAQKINIKDHIDNEMDFYLGVVITTIFVRYMYKVLKYRFTEEQIKSVSKSAVAIIFDMIPKLKKEIKSRQRL